MHCPNGSSNLFRAFLGHQASHCKVIWWLPTDLSWVLQKVANFKFALDYARFTSYSRPPPTVWRCVRFLPSNNMTEGKREEVMLVVPQHRDMDNINAYYWPSIQPLTREIINSMFSGCMPARRSVQAKQNKNSSCQFRSCSHQVSRSLISSKNPTALASLSPALLWSQIQFPFPVESLADATSILMSRS